MRKVPIPSWDRRPPAGKKMPASRRRSQLPSLPTVRPVYAPMGYIIGLVLLIVIVPWLFLMLSRRTKQAGGIAHNPGDSGVTVAKPSSDQPTPRADATNQPAPGAERRIPPG